MAISEIYVDPSIAADSGTGTVGDPFGDLQYAIIQTTFDTTNGTRVNIKAGTEEVLTAGLEVAIADTSVSVAWVPSRTAPMIFQGYTTAAGDGGMGVISSGGATQAILDNATLDYVSFIDLELHNTGLARILRLDDGCSIIRCKIHNAGNGVTMGDNAVIMGCHYYDVAVEVILLENEGYAAFNIVDTITGTRTATAAISCGNTGSVAYRNIIKVDGATDGIKMVNKNSVISNSVYSAGGTGRGIYATAANLDQMVCINNLVEGFSGTGGDGIDFSVGGIRMPVYGGNSVYDCATAYNNPAIIIESYGGNETLSASPFTDPTNNDFSPVDTGSVKEGVTPSAFFAV